MGCASSKTVDEQAISVKVLDPLECTTEVLPHQKSQDTIIIQQCEPREVVQQSLSKTTAQEPVEEPPQISPKIPIKRVSCREDQPIESQYIREQKRKEAELIAMYEAERQRMLAEWNAELAAARVPAPHSSIRAS